MLNFTIHFFSKIMMGKLWDAYTGELSREDVVPE